MVPIHESDIGAERWKKQEWDNFELWEKIERKHLKRKIFWVILAVCFFLVLSSVPVFLDQIPKWDTLRASRVLAHELTLLKKAAAIEHQAFKLTIKRDTSYVIERGSSCQVTQFERVREGVLDSSGLYASLDGETASSLQIPGVVITYCYDFLSGSPALGVDAFAIIPVKDLTDVRLDRVSFSTISGVSSEIDFN